MNKKTQKIIIISILVVVLIAMAVVLTLNKKQKNNNILPAPEFEEVYTPRFMDEERKAFHGLAPETKVQVFSDSDGKEVYKIIRDDSEIVTDLEAAGLK